MYKKTTQSRNIAVKVKESGYGLIDLLFTLLLSAILLGLAFPTYRHLSIEVRLLSLTERIRSAINYARSEAIRRQDVVTLCKSKDGKTCTGTWHDGWIVFLGKVKENPVENSLLRVYSALNENEFLAWHGAGGRDYVQLNPDGSAYGHNGSFVICVKVGSKKTMWLIRMSPTGRVRVDKDIEYRWHCNY
jgi:type IV fimbrial biogenesis protein FimT